MNPWRSDAGLGCLLKMATRPLLLAAYYHAKGSFAVEQRALFTGRVRYHRDVASADGHPLFLLRRNTHRIEKGLFSKDRRSFFALGYIDETVSAFGQVARLEGQSSRPGQASVSTLLWAADVLGQYFDVVESSPETERAGAAFREALATYRLATADKSPSTQSEMSAPPADYQLLYALAHRRHSVRWYQSLTVPHDLLDRAVDIARQSPSACNRQPIRFRILEDPTLIQSLARLAGGAEEFLSNIPCLVAVIGQQRAYFSDRDAHLIYIDCSLATMSLVFGLESLGLSSCCINWPNARKEDAEATALLGLEADERIILLLSVGFQDPHKPVASAGKRSIDELRSYDQR